VIDGFVLNTSNDNAGDGIVTISVVLMRFILGINKP